MSDFRTAMDLDLERRSNIKVEREKPSFEPQDGCPESFHGNLKIHRYYRKQPLVYQKFGGEYVNSFQLCPPKGYRDNWHRCPYK